MIQEAITEAKTHAKQRSQEMKVKAQTVSNGRGRITARHYKQVSKEARRQGEARQLLEDMVHRAERKLAEVQRKSHAGTQSAESRAEELAAELFHRPGSLLTQEEIAKIVMESECRGRPEGEMPVCFTPTYEIFRTINGSCNNLQNPLVGAADTALTRLIPSQYEDGIASLRGSIQNRRGSIFNTTAFEPPNPSARHVSESVIQDLPRDERLTHILMQFGQFIDHDLSLTPELRDECEERTEHCEFTNVCQQIRVTDLDPKFGLGTSNNGACIAFSRSLAACPDAEEPLVNRGILSREQINVLTSFIDGSMIYGSDAELASLLREFSGGLLKEGSAQPGKKPELPRISEADNRRSDGEPFVGCTEAAYGTLGCFLAGEFRVNEQVVLSVMHTLWFREHNRIARELATLNPSWDDEWIYQEARKIVGAILQKIVYYDYLPKIFGKRIYDIVVGEFDTYDPRINPGVNNAFSTAAYRYGHTLIRPFFDRLDSSYQNTGTGPLELSQVFFNPDQFRASFGTDPLTRGLITQTSRRVDEFLSTVLTSNLFRTHLDLASLNIQRGRDHGLPPYLTWQRYCKEVFPELMDARFENVLTYVRFLELYGSLDTLDLWVGGLAEEREAGSLLGPTFACLFGITFANIRDGDRFYFKANGVFETAQRESIEQHSLAAIICDNGDSIDQLQEDVFLSGQPRVPCSSIPRINLQLWQENQCHFRVAVEPRRFKLPVRATSRNSPSAPYTFYARTVEGSTEETSICVPIECPGRDGGSVIGFYLRPSNVLGRFLRVIPNVLLPASGVSQPSYSAFWLTSMFGASNTGIYRSLAACERTGASAALTVQFLRQQAQEQEMEEALAAQTENLPNPASPETDEQIPQDLREFFENFFFGTPTQPPTTQAEVESDAQLMSELEDALKSLNG